MQRPRHLLLLPPCLPVGQLIGYGWWLVGCGSCPSNACLAQPRLTPLACHPACRALPLLPRLGNACAPPLPCLAACRAAAAPSRPSALRAPYPAFVTLTPPQRFTPATYAAASPTPRPADVDLVGAALPAPCCLACYAALLVVGTGSRLAALPSAYCRCCSAAVDGG